MKTTEIVGEKMTGKELVLCEYSRLFLGSSKQSQKGSECLEEAREGTLARFPSLEVGPLSSVRGQGVDVWHKASSYSSGAGHVASEAPATRVQASREEGLTPTPLWDLLWVTR